MFERSGILGRGLPEHPLRHRTVRRARLHGVERHELGAGAWVDVVRGWLIEPDDVFATLVKDVPWRAERRRMYDRIVDVPRLVYTYMIGEELPHPVLTAAREALTEHYLPELGEPFRTAGCCYYRDGRDSVAWHGDTIGRGTPTTRWSRSSPSVTRADWHCARATGPTDRARLSFEMGHGDLVVMGGSCQRTWEHAVPKVASAGPRISVQYRPLNVF